MSDKFVHKTNSGSLFKNTEKTEQNPNWADMQGTINVDGKEYWISGWFNESKGGRYIGLQVKAKDHVHSQGVDQAKAAVDAQHAMQAPADFDDDLDSLPF